MTDQRWTLPEESHRQSSPQLRRGEGIHAFAWGIWPWMNWLLPIAAIFLVGNGGWGLLLLMVVSPVVVPVLGLLGSLPRFILRKSGYTDTPVAITVLLFIQWWAWFTAMITPPGATDGSPIPAVMLALSPHPMSNDFLLAVLAGTSGVAVASWIAVLVIAIVTAVRSGAEERGPKAWTVAAWVGAFALPVLFAALIWLGGVVTGQQPDAAGATVAEVRAQSLSMQAERALTRYEQAQARLSQIRGMIAEEGWELATWGIESRVSTAGVASYGFDLRFEHGPLPDGPLDVDAVKAELLAQGWTAGERGTVVDREGNAVEVAATDGHVWVSLTSPGWWGYNLDLEEELGGYDLGHGAFERTYAYDEWPKL